MKKLFTLTLLLALAISSYAQEYILEVEEGNYEFLIGDTSLIKDSIKQSDKYFLNFLFRPKFNGDTSRNLNREYFEINPLNWADFLYFNDQGSLRLYPFGLGIKTGTGTTPIKYQKNTNDTLSNISYVVEGGVGKRTFKAQYRNMLYEEANIGDKINFQVWWHEATGVIEYHYGKINITNFGKAFGGSDTAPYVILNADTNKHDEVEELWHSYYGNPKSPSVQKALYDIKRLNTIPNEGLIYRFVPTFFTGIDDNNPFKEFKIYPNPSSNGTIYLDQLPKEENIVVSVIDLTGRLVKRVSLNAQEMKQSFTIDNPGIYVIKLESESGYTASRKVLVN